MGATPSSIVVAEMQAKTARDSFVMTSHPLDNAAAAVTSISFTEQLRQLLFLDKPDQDAHATSQKAASETSCPPSLRQLRTASKK
jgi:hypothetical protein